MGLIKIHTLKKEAKIALDTVIFIYFLEQHPVYFETVKELFRRIETDKLTAVMSSLVFTELLVPAYRADDITTVNTLSRLLINFPNIKTVPVSNEISIEAARLRAILGMKTPDAIHAATALKMDADAIITNDKDFLKLREHIDIILLDAA